jgi:hypothetical protein
MRRLDDRGRRHDRRLRHPGAHAKEYYSFNKNSYGLWYVNPVAGIQDLAMGRRLYDNNNS